MKGGFKLRKTLELRSLSSKKVPTHKQQRKQKVKMQNHKQKKRMQKRKQKHENVEAEVEEVVERSQKFW